MNWRPIVTAPKNGDPVLLYRPSRGCCLGEWYSDEYARKPRPYWASYSVFSKTEDREDAPTHWMPLPEPPKALEQRRPR